MTHQRPSASWHKLSSPLWDFITTTHDLCTPSLRLSAIGCKYWAFCVAWWGWTRSIPTPLHLLFQKDLDEFLLTRLLCGRCLLLWVLILIHCVTALDTSWDHSCFTFVWCLRIWSLLSPATTLSFLRIFPHEHYYLKY